MRDYWINPGTDTSSQEIIAHLKATLSQKLAGNCKDYLVFLEDFVLNKRVLDIGVLDYGNYASGSDTWKFKRICQKARKAVGIDIYPEEIAKLRDQGYDVLTVDATSEIDLGMVFDRVILGNVIQAVDNPVNLLRFARRHLDRDGLILATAGNPFYASTILSTIFQDGVISDPNFISWLSPSMALEVGRRAGVNLKEYWLLQSPGVGTLLARWLKQIVCAWRPQLEIYSYGFAFIYEKIGK
jgi:SAM-dependent methyltransferase